MNKDKKKKIAKIVISVVTGIITLLVCYILICNIVAMRKERPVKVFGFSYSYVPTPSMEPVIKQGDSVIFKDASYSSLKVGDIIVYKSATGETKGLYILHRIVDSSADGFIMKGDNNTSVDPEVVTSDMYMGKYVKTFNFLNIGKLAYHKDAIYTILIIFFVGIIILESVNIALVNYRKKSRRPVDRDKLREELLEEMKEELRAEITNDINNKEDEK